VADSKSPEEFGDAEQKYLELIQGVIARQAQNSFLLKGWSVTLVAAILALASRNPSCYLVVIAVFPALVFWGLDAFYLGQERHFRDMYKDARAGNIPVLCIDPHSYESGFKGWLGSVVSRSVFPLHLVVVVVVIAATFISWKSAW
jgi:hypothetical protein